MSSVILSVDNLFKKYGKLIAVDQVCFTVNREEIFGILGPNGAGKTSTIEMIETLRPIDGGTVVLDGLDVKQYSHQIGVGYNRQRARNPQVFAHNEMHATNRLGQPRQCRTGPNFLCKR